MHFRITSKLLLPCMIAVLFAACGQKGPLRLPEEKASPAPEKAEKEASLPES